MSACNGKAANAAVSKNAAVSTNECCRFYQRVGGYCDRQVECWRQREQKAEHAQEPHNFAAGLSSKKKQNSDISLACELAGVLHGKQASSPAILHCLRGQTQQAKPATTRKHVHQ
jgi:hypothetical protein